MKSLVEEASTITKAVEKAWVRAGKPAEFTVKVFEEPKHNFFGMTTKSAKIAIFFKSTPAVSGQQEAKDTKHVQKDSVRKPQPARQQYESAPARPTQQKNYSSDTRGEREQRSSAPRPAKNDRRDSRDYPKQSEAPREQREWQESRPARQEYSTGQSDFKERSHQERSSYNDRPSSSRDLRSRERPEAVWSNEMADIAQDWLENMLIVLDKRELLAQAKVVGPNLKFEFKEPVIHDKEKEKLLFASWAHLMLASVGNKYKKDLHGLKVVLLSSE